MANTSTKTSITTSGSTINTVPYDQFRHVTQEVMDSRGGSSSSDALTGACFIAAHVGGDAASVNVSARQIREVNFRNMVRKT